MSVAARLPFSPEDFLDWEARQEDRHEYHGGEVFAMAGGTETHARIIGNVYFYLRGGLRGSGCTAYTEVMRVRIDAADVFTYPDVSVVCGEARFYDRRRTTLVNPTALVEVLSPSTETYDRTTKFGLYTQIPDLQTYVIVSQDAPAVDVYLRDGDGWRVTHTTEGEAPLGPLGVSLVLAEVYGDVTFPGPEERLRPAPGAPSTP